MNCSDITTKPLRGEKFRQFASYITEGGGSIDGKLRLFEVFNKSAIQACLHGHWSRAKQILQNQVLNFLGISDWQLDNNCVSISSKLSWLESWTFESQQNHTTSLARRWVKMIDLGYTLLCIGFWYLDGTFLFIMII